MCFAPQRRALFRHLNFQKWSEHGVLCTFWLRNCFAPQRRALFRHLNFQKWSFFVHFDFEMCFAPQRRALFRHLNFQKWSEHVVFVHFDFEMCFAPQRRALFRHLNFQKWSEHVVFCTFWLRNVLRATTACTFSTSQLPKVVRDRQFLTLLTSKCASRHNGVRFFDIWTSKSGPNPWCF